MRTSSRAIAAVALLLAMTVLAAPAFAADFHVDASASPGGDGSPGAPYQTISAAITAASSGDSVLVAAGTYAESLSIAKNITVAGEGFNVCTIDAQGTGFSAVRFYSGSDGAVIYGFHVIHGVGTMDFNGRMVGGGVFCESASPSVRDCLITDNVADYGGGVGATDASPVIEDCWINNNVANFFGGGVMDMFGTPVISNCVIDANAGSDGGGLFFMMSPGTPTVTNTTVADNTGDGVKYFMFAPTVTNSIVWGNGENTGVGVTVAYSCIEDLDDVGPGVIHTQPDFRSAATSDYSLVAGSPCVDTADAGSAPAGDILGTARPLDGDGDTVAAPDMGAFEFDPVPPVTTLDPADTWHAAPVTVTISAIDAGGVAGTFFYLGTDAPQPYPGSFAVSDEGATWISYFSTDFAGNVEATQTAYVGVDLTPPTTTDDAPSGWRNALVTVTLTADDPLSGVASTLYSLDGGPEATYSGAPIAFSAEGTSTLEYASIDEVGNRESTQTTTIALDLTPPTTTSDARAEYDRSAVISLSAFDELSGVESTWVSVDDGPFKLATGPATVAESGDHTITFYSVDVAGNVEAESSAAFTVTQQGGDLPHTGGDLLVLLGAALGALVVGFALRFAGRHGGVRV